MFSWEGANSLVQVCEQYFHCMASCKRKLQEFLHLNSIHWSIKLMMEDEEKRSLLLLDILVSRKPDGALGHIVCRKPTHTDLYLHAKSKHHLVHRKGSTHYTHPACKSDLYCPKFWCGTKTPKGGLQANWIQQLGYQLHPISKIWATSAMSGAYQCSIVTIPAFCHKRQDRHITG